MGLKISIFSLFFLLFHVEGLVDPKENRSGGSLEWEILTKKNFSSQIRIHPHILLVVTVPWSGESRSLMKDVAHQAASKREKLNHLRLMVVYRNAEKMLADVLGATEGITIFCYHHTTAYKYQGRLRARNILSSAYHLMSLQSEELPLKHLNTPEDLKAFLRSTDKAVLLLEFCGWTPRLLQKSKDDGRERVLHVRDASQNESIFGENFNGEASRTVPISRKENQKVAAQGLQNEEPICGVETGLGGIPWLGDIMFANQNASLRVENRVGMGMSCTFEEFQRFESFFSNFSTIAREYFLPPERQRFGLVSERSLLSFLGIREPDTWLLMLQFIGCPNCSKILKERDDLKNAMLMHHPLVTELEGEGDGLEPALPANRPSIVLFVDRSSESSKIRRTSKSALEDFRELAWENQFSNQMITEQDSINTEGFSSQTFPGMRSKAISDPSGLATMKLSPATRLVKFKDQMAYIIDDGGTGNAQGNSVRDVLAYLLQQKNPLFHIKEEKISVLAREAGFQLLSDDFKVKIVDALPLREGNDQSENPESQISEQPIKYVVENSIDLKDNNLLNSIPLVEHGEQPEVIEVETSLQDNQETTAQLEENAPLITTESTQEVKKGEHDTVENMGISDNHSCKEKDVGPSMHHAKQPFPLEQDPHVEHYHDEHIHEDHGLHAEGGLNDMSSNEIELTCSGDCSGTAIIGNVAKEDSSTRGDKMEDYQSEHQGFKGSFFFSDGGYRLLRMLTADSKIPSAVILDPVLQRHFVFPEKTVFSHSSLVHFVDGFLNGSLPPYQRSEPFPGSPRETPRPPFVNLDFREADSIPRVTVKMFSELVLGDQCNGGYAVSCSDTQNFAPAWKKDVLVLFSNTWCGFCQRMELVVREVYRAFKGYVNVLKSESNSRQSTFIRDNVDDVMLNELPLIFFMDCTLNDCSALLKSMGQRELYPALMLFPAEKKDAVSYQGDISVAKIIEFIAAHGTNSHHLSQNKGILWTGTRGGGNMDELHDASSSSIHETTAVKGDYHEVLLNSTPKQRDKHHSIRLHTSDGFQEGSQHVGIGSVLTATDKLLNASPFDKSKVIIVKADQNEGFQGLIINKRIKWDVLPDLEEEFAPLKQARLSFGGPVIAPGMPLVSFTRRANEAGYLEIFPSFYYGDQLATSEVIEGIKSMNRSAVDFWFFLGYSGWGWDQLSAELAEGSWLVDHYRVDQIYWPEI
ncbi:uncharacterized protein LOC131242956 [Magnolia sinica]|uniref:uncharacterized protein LOC131242956 n=1 Tax=Magnolia sinica TaxID=86752 RepID=UPI002657DA80|nr:uncharacterized protein LOC131242956 [Magnolia sinica]